MADRYFVDGGVDNDWSGTDNWSTSTGGAGGETVPGTGDDVYLDDNSPDCDLDTAGNILSFDATGYTGEFTMAANMTVSGDVTLVSGMTFTPSTYKWTVDGTSTLTSGGKSFYDLFIKGAVDITISGVADVTNTFTPQETNNAAATISGDAINISGDMDIPGLAILDGDSTFNFDGTSTQLIDFGGMEVTNGIRACDNPITINNTSATVTVSTDADRVAPIRGGWDTHASATVDFTTNTSHIEIRESSKTYDFQANDLYKLTINSEIGNTTTFASNTTITNTLKFNTVSSTINGSKLLAEGDVEGTLNQGNIGGTTVLEVSGGENQDFDLSGSTSSSRTWGLDIVFNKSGGTCTMDAAFGELAFETSADITYTAGTIDWATNTVKAIIQASVTLDTDGMDFYDVNLSAGTQTLSSDITIGGDLTDSGGTLAGNYAVILTGTGAVDGSIDFYSLTVNGTYTFDDADTYTINASGVLNGTGTISSDHGTNKVTLTNNGSNTVGMTLSGTRVDSSGGNAVVTDGTIIDCLNWEGAGGSQVWLPLLGVG